MTRRQCAFCYEPIAECVCDLDEDQQDGTDEDKAQG